MLPDKPFSSFVAAWTSRGDFHCLRTFLGGTRFERRARSSCSGEALTTSPASHLRFRRMGPYSVWTVMVSRSAT